MAGILAILSGLALGAILGAIFGFDAAMTDTEMYGSRSGGSAMGGFLLGVGAVLRPHQRRGHLHIEGCHSDDRQPLAPSRPLRLYRQTTKLSDSANQPRPCTNRMVTPGNQSNK